MKENITERVSGACWECNWSNINLLNLGEPNEPRYICHGCCKRTFDLKMNQKDKAYQLIESHVAGYRMASESRKSKEGSLRAFEMQMDRASGALDILFELFPDSEAWRDTKWTH